MSPHARLASAALNEEVAVKIAQQFAALSDPSRVRILAIATNEEVAIARASYALLAGEERLPS